MYGKGYQQRVLNMMPVKSIVASNGLLLHPGIGLPAPRLASMQNPGSGAGAGVWNAAGTQNMRNGAGWNGDGSTATVQLHGVNKKQKMFE